MQSSLSTTPFGRRLLTVAMVATQAAAKTRPPNAAVHESQVFHATCEGRAKIGVTDRAIAVLNALLTFHPETTLTGEGDVTVFPSNEQLVLRAHSMAPATLRRHLAVLVDCGLVIRRDSPNGKRYAQKEQGGAIENAFGFDLTPLVARAAEFESLAEAARAERRALLLVRERITVCRRDVVKMIATGAEEGVPGDWTGFHQAYLGVAGRIPRTATVAELEPLADELDCLAGQVRKALEDHINSSKISANESQNERHIQNSNTQPKFESEHGFPTSQEPTVEPDNEPKRPLQRSYPLGMILDACPSISDYAGDGISSWRDFVETAEFIRSLLSTSPSTCSFRSPLRAPPSKLGASTTTGRAHIRASATRRPTSSRRPSTLRITGLTSQPQPSGRQRVGPPRHLGPSRSDPFLDGPESSKMTPDSPYDSKEVGEQIRTNTFAVSRQQDQSTTTARFVAGLALRILRRAAPGQGPNSPHRSPRSIALQHDSDRIWLARRQYGEASFRQSLGVRETLGHTPDSARLILQHLEGELRAKRKEPAMLHRL